MKIRPLAIPRLKHKQRVNRGQAHRFFQDVLKWLKHANKRISDMKCGRSNYIAERKVKIEAGLARIQGHIEYLKDRGFSDMKIERDLNVVEEKLAELTKET